MSEDLSDALRRKQAELDDLQSTFDEFVKNSTELEDELEESLSLMEKQLREAKAAKKDAESKMKDHNESMEKEMKSLRNENKDLQSRFSKEREVEREQYASLSEENKQLRNRLSTKIQESEEHTKRYESLSEENRALNRRLTQKEEGWEKRYEKLSVEKEEVETALSSREIDEYQLKVAKLVAENEGLVSRLSIRDEEYTSLQTRLGVLEQEAATHTEQSEMHRLEQAEKIVTEWTEKVDVLKSTLSDMEITLSNANKEKEQMSEKVAILQQEKEKMHSRLTTLQSTMDGRVGKDDTDDATTNKEHGATEKVQESHQAFQKLKEKYAQLIRDYQRKDQEYDKVKEEGIVALQKLQSRFDEDKKSLEESVSDWESKCGVYETNLKDLMQKFTLQQGIAATLTVEKENWMKEKEDLIAEKEKEVAQLSDVNCALMQETQEKDDSITETQDLLAKKEATLSEMTLELSGKSIELEKIQKVVDALEADLRSARPASRLHDAEGENDNLREEVQLLKQQSEASSAMDSKLQALEQENIHLKKDVESLTQQIRESNDALTIAEGKLQAMTGDNGTLRKEVELLRTQVQQSIDDTATAANALQKMQERNSSLEKEMDMLIEKGRDGTDRKEGSNDVNDLRQKLFDLQAQQSDHQSSIATLEKEVIAANEYCNESDTKMNRLLSEKEEVEKEKDLLQSEVNTLTSAVESMSKTVQDTQNEQQHLREIMRDSHEEVVYNLNKILIEQQEESRTRVGTLEQEILQGKIDSKDMYNKQEGLIKDLESHKLVLLESNEKLEQDRNRLLEDMDLWMERQQSWEEERAKLVQERDALWYEASNAQQVIERLQQTQRILSQDKEEENNGENGEVSTVKGDTGSGLLSLSAPSDHPHHHQLVSLSRENRQLYQYNAHLLSRLQSIQGNIQVLCRVRPPLPEEMEPMTPSESNQTTTESAASTDPGSTIVAKDAERVVADVLSPNEVALYDRNRGMWRGFTYDKVHGPDSSQRELYEDVEPFVQQFLDGYNVCLFAYGQTGSGKTYTMAGPPELITGNNSASMVAAQDAGLASRCLKKIFVYLQQQEADIGLQYLARVALHKDGESDQDNDHTNGDTANSAKDAQNSKRSALPSVPAISSFNFTLSLSMMEIYNETIVDLLDPSAAHAIESHTGQNGSTTFGKEDSVVTNAKPLDIRSREDGDMYVTNLTRIPCASLADVLLHYSAGNDRRSSRATKSNEFSSRSHCITTIYLTTENKGAEGGTGPHATPIYEAGTTTRGSKTMYGNKHVTITSGPTKNTGQTTSTSSSSTHGYGSRADSMVVSRKLHIVDLAGSERVQKSGVEGASLKEAQHINRSLSALGDVMEGLDRVGRQAHNTPKKGEKESTPRKDAPKKMHIPYRNSKLTHFLKDALGGNSKTIMIVNISPVISNLEESLCTLQFASRVRSIDMTAVTTSMGNGGVRRNVDTKNLTTSLQQYKNSFKEARSKLMEKEREVEKTKREMEMLQSKLMLHNERTERSKEEAERIVEQQLHMHKQTAENLKSVLMDEKQTRTVLLGQIEELRLKAGRSDDKTEELVRELETMEQRLEQKEQMIVQLREKLRERDVIQGGNGVETSTEGNTVGKDAHHRHGHKNHKHHGHKHTNNTNASKDVAKGATGTTKSVRTALSSNSPNSSDNSGSVSNQEEETNIKVTTDTSNESDSISRDAKTGGDANGEKTKDIAKAKHAQAAKDVKEEEAVLHTPINRPIRRKLLPSGAKPASNVSKRIPFSTYTGPSSSNVSKLSEAAHHHTLNLLSISNQPVDKEHTNVSLFGFHTSTASYPKTPPGSSKGKVAFGKSTHSALRDSSSAINRKSTSGNIKSSRSISVAAPTGPVSPLLSANRGVTAGRKVSCLSIREAAAMKKHQERLLASKKKEKSDKYW